jgi:hypothetical protein
MLCGWFGISKQAYYQEIRKQQVKPKSKVLTVKE